MHSFRQLTVAAFATALALAAGLPAARAQDGTQNSTQSSTQTTRQDRLVRLMKLVDKDGDGFISAPAAERFAAARFDRLDTDHQGYLTLDAFEAPLRRAIDRASDVRRPQLEKALPRLEAAFKSINKAGDGRLTKAEFLADSRARFAAADTDKDGKLTLDELRHARGHAF